MGCNIAAKQDLPCKKSRDKQQQLSIQSQARRKMFPTDGDGLRSGATGFSREPMRL